MPAATPTSPAIAVSTIDSFITIAIDRERRRAERLAHADLLGALLDRDQHDVRHADDAGEQRRAADDPADIADSTKKNVSNLPNITNMLNEPIASWSSGATRWCRASASRTWRSSSGPSAPGFAVSAKKPDAIADVERGLQRRERHEQRVRVAIALLAGAQRARDADDLEVDAADLDVLADRIDVRREQLVAHRAADHRDLAALGDVALVDEATGLVLERDDVLELGVVGHHGERCRSCPRS